MKGKINLKEYVYDYIRDGKKYELKKIIYLLNILGNPQEDFKTIHVTGTNGKGSTSTYIENIIHSAGFKVGKFTSPHLVRYNERIRFDLKEINDVDLKYILPDLEEAARKTEERFEVKPSFFEMMTAMAFLFFSRKKVDYAVVEVGLGGRLDATNTVKNSISVITTIDKDHTGILGSTMTAIAKEKAGIIKNNSVCISGVKQPHLKNIIRQRCNETKTRLCFLKEDFKLKNMKIKKYGCDFDYIGEKDIEGLHINMPGRHQVDNASLAIRVAEELNIETQKIREGIAKAKFPGRLEFFKKEPSILFDGAHNRSGIDALYEYMRKNWQNNKVIVVCTILRDKDAKHFYSRIGKIADKIIITSIDNKRLMDIDFQRKVAEEYNQEVLVIEDLKKALDSVIQKQKKNELLLITGSLYLIGEVKRTIADK